MHANLSKSERTDKIGSLCTDTRLTEMLRTKNNDCVDMVFLFVAAMVNRCRGPIDVSMNIAL